MRSTATLVASFLLFAAFEGAIVGCASPDPFAPRSVTDPSPPEPMVLTTLFCGMSSKDGTGVSEQQWETFLHDVVTPRFPDGLTVVDAAGQYREGDSGPVRTERARLLLIVRRRDAASSAKVEEIRSWYVREFHQESVLQTDGIVDARFD